MNLAIGIPAYRMSVDARLAVSLAHLALAKPKEWGMVSMVVDSCFVSHARNQLVYQALGTILPGGAKLDWLLMIDSDCYQLDPRPVLQMLKWANGDEHTAPVPVIAAPVPGRGGAINIGRFLNGETGPPGGEPRMKSGPPFEVERVGTAFMAIHLPWLRAHMPAAPWFRARYPAQVRGDAPVVIGEDWDFCDQVRVMGGGVFCDPRCRPAHAKGEAGPDLKTVR